MLTIADVVLVTGRVALAWLACIAVVVCVSLWFAQDER